MSNELVSVSSGLPGEHTSSSTDNMFVTMTVDGQCFGIPVLQVQDVLGPQKIARIPLAPAEIAGSLNLRGRIVTAVDLRIRLNLQPRAADAEGMNVVFELHGELYSLVVDKVGEVMTLSSANYEKNPPTLNASWQHLSSGVYRLDGSLLVVLDVAKVLQLEQNVAA